MTQYASLAGQVAVVTGGSRGIGRQIARNLAAAGATVAVTGRSSKHLDETVSIIQGDGGTCKAFIMDVTDAEQVQTVMGRIKTELGPVDLLVNNAGIGAEGAYIWQVETADWWHVLEINVRGVFLCSQAVLGDMVERQQGRIINLGSNAAFFGDTPMASAYAVSKAALVRLSENMANEVYEQGVRVFCISPGLVYTDMTKDVPIFQDLPPDAWVPIEKAGELCVVLASGDADALSGRFVHVVEDDIHDLIKRANEITENDSHAMRLIR